MSKSLHSKIENIKHRKLDLSDASEIINPPCRPELRVWAECEPCDPPHVALGISALWGQPQRFVDLTPAEARALSAYLLAVVNDIENVTDNHEPIDPPGFEAGFAANH